MKNSSEYLKQCVVPTTSEMWTIDKLNHDKVDQVKRRTYWGNNDFKALIKLNMEGSRYGEKNRE